MGAEKVLFFISYPVFSPSSVLSDSFLSTPLFAGRFFEVFPCCASNFTAFAGGNLILHHTFATDFLFLQFRRYGLRQRPPSPLEAGIAQTIRSIPFAHMGFQAFAGAVMPG